MRETSLISNIMQSWECVDGNVNSTEDVLSWIQYLNNTTYVNINECSIQDSEMWFYDEYNGEILNRKNSFFSVKGMRYFVNGRLVTEQPIIVQPEIGYLGIICKKINGVLNFLMQAKIEPGNVNCVQISPTIQATKSNFTRAHGGKLPAYFDYFENSQKYNVIYDQIQSEQGTRFFQKRNRNMIMIVDEDIPVAANFKWMTLGQIKKLMDIDNLVNMDTRTVLSGIPFVSYNTSRELSQIRNKFTDETLYKSIFETSAAVELPRIFGLVNNYKMFNDAEVVTIPLKQLVDWQVDEFGVVCSKNADFIVRYYDIEISGREVRKWSQPLFKAIGKATFGLITKTVDGVKKFLVKIVPEIGLCDQVEIGPSVIWAPSHSVSDDNIVDAVFRNALENNTGIKNKVVLSEEGGRFYHEQNNNVIIEIADNMLCDLPENYIWVNFSTLNYLVQINNCLNIQLRNLLSLTKL